MGALHENYAENIQDWSSSINGCDFRDVFVLQFDNPRNSLGEISGRIFFSADSSKISSS